MNRNNSHPRPRRGGKNNNARVASNVAHNAIRAANKREHGFIPSRTTHRIAPFKDTKIYNTKLLATYQVTEDPTGGNEDLTLNVSDILSALNQLGIGDLKIIAIKAFVDSPTTSIADPPTLSFEDGFSSLGGFSEKMTVELVRDFTSQTLVASIHPPLDDWLRDTAQIRLGNITAKGAIRTEIAVQLRTTLPTLTFLKTKTA